MLLPTLLAFSLSCSGNGTYEVNHPPHSGEEPGDSPPTDTVELSTVDADADGWPASEDCDDENSAVFPGHSEQCDGVDEDCDGEIDDDPEGPEWEGYADADDDGYGAGELLTGCGNRPKDASYQDGDCDDADPAVHPEVEDRCDGVDDDCDGEDGYAGLWYGDSDGDGWGVGSDVSTLCGPPAGYVASAGDCNDSDASISPSGIEVCDGADQNCDAVVDDGPWYTDADADGYGDDDSAVATCSVGLVVHPGDCDDGDSTRNPASMEECDGIDQDCDTWVDEHLTCTTCDDAELPFDVYVPDDVPTIQAALDGAVDGDRICVREGTYTESIDFQGKNVLLYGEAGAARTTIDAGGAASAVVTFTNSESEDAQLQGFTLTGGSGNLDSFEGSGTTDYCSASPTPHRLTLWCGGGVSVDSANPTLTDLIVRDMHLQDWSIWVGGTAWKPIVYDEVGIGGAFCFRNSDSVLTRVDVIDNRAWEGGVAFVDNASKIEWTQSVWSENSAGNGGGIYADGGGVTLTNVWSDSNEADADGALLYSASGVVTLTNVTSSFDASAGGAVFTYYSTTTLTNVLVAQPTASAGIYAYTYSDAAPAVSYTLSWDPGGTPFAIWNGGSMLTMDGVDGNFSSDPLFVSASDDGWPRNDDLRLGEGSPAIDAGDPAILDADGTRSDVGVFGGPAGSW